MAQVNIDLLIYVTDSRSNDCTKPLTEHCNTLQGALDATGACCDGVVDNFGVCNGYDASGVFQVALAEGSSVTPLASALGLSSSKIVSASE